MKFALTIALLLSMFIGNAARAGGGWEGFAVSPDGKTLLVGGNTRTIYELDAATLKVTRRHWFGHTIGSIHYNTDGSQVMIIGGFGDDDAYILDTGNFRELKKLERIDVVSHTAAAGRLVVQVNKFGNRKLMVLDEKDFSTVQTIELPKERQPVLFSLSTDGTHLVMLSRQEKDETEIPIARDDLRAIKDRFERNTTQRRHDQYTSHLVIYDVAGGEEISDQKLWYSTSARENQLQLAHTDGVTCIIEYSDVNVRIDAEGNITPFQLHRYGYGTAISPDGKTLVSGSLIGNGECGAVMEGDSVTPIVAPAERLPGFPEYFSRMVVLPDGRIFGTTTAFRVFRLAKQDGQYIFDAIKPVY